MKSLWARVALIPVLVWAVATLSFFLLRAVPGGPFDRERAAASREVEAALKARYHWDEPLWRQYLRYLGNLLQGDLGRSWVTGSPVAEEIRRVLPITLELITISFVLAFFIAVPLGMLCALRPGGTADRITFGYSLFAGSQPEFWWALLFIFVFFATLGWAPPPLGRLDPMIRPPPAITGFITIDTLMAGDLRTFRDALHHLALPVLTKVFVLSGPIIKMVRQNMVRVLASDYILYARGSGLRPGRIAWMALKNALAPAMTLLGVLYGYILGSAVLIESVFSLGGIGQYAVRSVLAFDYPAIQAVVLVIAAISLFVYLALDVAHALIDPRIVT